MVLCNVGKVLLFLLLNCVSFLIIYLFFIFFYICTWFYCSEIYSLTFLISGNPTIGLRWLCHVLRETFHYIYRREVNITRSTINQSIHNQHPHSAHSDAFGNLGHRVSSYLTARSNPRAIWAKYRIICLNRFVHVSPCLWVVRYSIFIYKKTGL